MSNSNNAKPNNKTIIKIAVAAGAVLLVMLIIALIINLVRLGAANSRKEALEAQNAKLERLIDENENAINYCNSSEFIKSYAREYLDMIYRGETVVGESE